MHFESPGKVARSIREFLGHYVMIVVSILSALAAEQIADYAYNKHKAHAFREQIEIELAANKSMVEQALKDNQRTLAYWNGLLQRAQGLAPACGDEADPAYRGVLKDAVTNYRENTPILQTSGWESAVAVGSVVYFDAADVRRFSNAYSMQRFYAAAMDSALNGSMSNMSDLGALVHEPARACTTAARLVNARVRMLAVLASNLQELRAELAR